MDIFVLLKFLVGAILPPASIATGLGIALAMNVAGRRRAAKLLAIFTVVQGIAFTLPPVADALISPLEQQARDAAQRAPACCYSAIVLLGGGSVPADPPAIPTVHLTDGADRIVRAARLFKQYLAPQIIVSGGRVMATQTASSEAEAMKELLVELGVPPESIIMEDKSRNTLENIKFVRDLVADAPVALVTSAYHMPRSLRISKAAGSNASAFPTDWRIPSSARPGWDNWLPTLDAQRTSALALREYIAAAFDFRHP